MKDGWEMKKLGDIVKIINGKNQSNVISQNGKYPILGSGGNIMGYATDFICEAGTTIIGRKGNISTPIYIAERFWNVDTAFGIYPQKDSSTKFIHYLCNTIDFKSFNRGTTIPSLVKTDLLNITVPFINSLPEQQRIVSILDQAFAAIDKAKANAEQNLRNVKELFESYLQGVFEKSGDGWEHTRLGDICQITDGTHFSPQNNSEGKYMYITAKNIKPFYIDLSKITYVSEEDHKEIYSRCKPSKGDILYIKDGATAGIAAINTIDGEFSMLSSVALLKCSTKILNTFLVYYMNSSVGKNNFLGYLDGAAITRLTLVKIKNVCFTCPPLFEQKSIVSQFNLLRAKTQKLESIYSRKIADLEELKKSILQKAFAGEI